MLYLGRNQLYNYIYSNPVFVGNLDQSPFLERLLSKIANLDKLYHVWIFLAPLANNSSGISGGGDLFWRSNNGGTDWWCGYFGRLPYVTSLLSLELANFKDIKYCISLIGRTVCEKLIFTDGRKDSWRNFT